MKEKFVPQGDITIWQKNDLGPWFGDCYPDLGLRDGKKCYTFFPKAYNREGPNKIPDNNETKLAFSGHSNQSGEIA